MSRNFALIAAASFAALSLLPQAAAAVPLHVDSPPAGNYQVDEKTVAKLWANDGVLYGTFIATDGDYGLLEGRPAAPGIARKKW